MINSSVSVRLRKWLWHGKPHTGWPINRYIEIVTFALWNEKMGIYKEEFTNLTKILNQKDYTFHEHLGYSGVPINSLNKYRVFKVMKELADLVEDRSTTRRIDNQNVHVHTCTIFIPFEVDEGYEIGVKFNLHYVYEKRGDNLIGTAIFGGTSKNARRPVRR